MSRKPCTHYVRYVYDRQLQRWVMTNIVSPSVYTRVKGIVTNRPGAQWRKLRH